MKIQIISTCAFKILEREFVDPLVRFVEKYGTVFKVHYKNPLDKLSDKTIISGTAIKDFGYLTDFPLSKLDKLGKVLGICAGAQILAKYFKVPLIEKELIGKFRLNDGSYAFFLITRIPDPKTIEKEFDVLAYMEDLPVLAKKGRFYLSLFHPEVLNQKILEDFLLDNI